MIVFFDNFERDFLVLQPWSVRTVEYTKRWQKLRRTVDALFNALFFRINKAQKAEKKLLHWLQDKYEINQIDFQFIVTLDVHL